jgi:hypothetical protein
MIRFVKKNMLLWYCQKLRKTILQAEMHTCRLFVIGSNPVGAT